jgi:hypothetical protein
VIRALEYLGGARSEPWADRLQGEIDFLTIQQLSQAVVVSAAHDLSERWFEISLEERRAIIQAIVAAAWPSGHQFVVDAQRLVDRGRAMIAR